jgi:hypothetical protein
MLSQASGVGTSVILALGRQREKYLEFEFCMYNMGDLVFETNKTTKSNQIKQKAKSDILNI